MVGEQKGKTCEDLRVLGKAVAYQHSLEYGEKEEG